MIDQNLIRNLFDYDPETGVFKRVGRMVRGGKIKPCNFVGKAESTHGYYQYTVKSKTYDVHRLIFMYVEGAFPSCDVDHIDGDRKENLKNSSRKSKPKSGVHGVGRQRRGGWRVWVGGSQYCGFASIEDAETFRLEKVESLGYSEGHLQREPWDED